LSAHPPPTGIYTLSLHDALPISSGAPARRRPGGCPAGDAAGDAAGFGFHGERDTGGVCGLQHRGEGLVEALPGGVLVGALREGRSEEHTSELQSRENLVCRLLLE